MREEQLHRRLVARLGCADQGGGPYGQHVISAAVLTQRAVRWKLLELHVRVGAGVQEHAFHLQWCGLVGGGAIRPAATGSGVVVDR